jgi:predicted Zn-dependent peptidase
VLALSGALADSDLIRRVSDGPLAALAVAGEDPKLAQLVLNPGEARLELPRLEAARLLMAWWQPAAADLDGVMGADLATSLLAEGRRSRLVDRLRERLRLVESIDLDLHAMECGSLALLEAVCEPEDLPQVRQAIEQVWREVMDQEIGALEWQRLRRLVTNAYRFGLESAGALAGLIGNSTLWGRRHSLARPLELLEGWSPERLRASALPLLDPSRAFILEAVPA